MAVLEAQFGNGPAELDVEELASEEEDRDSSLPVYKVLTYPADYTLKVLVDLYNEGRLCIPSFQRRFVWTQRQASRLVESFLLGLPVPPIYIFTPQEGVPWVVDGQQRLRSLVYFFSGKFGDGKSGSAPEFKLVGLDEKSPFLGLTFDDLGERHPTAYDEFVGQAVMRAFYIKQLQPDDHTSVYQVFERLNTGGTLLTPQEIRSCVSDGALLQCLIRVNSNASWRALLGASASDKRQRDIELLLRVLALRDARTDYRKPMKAFLNNFLDKHKSPAEQEVRRIEADLTSAVERVYQALGAKPFHLGAALNAAALDGVMVAAAQHLDRAWPDDLAERWSRLKADPMFGESIRAGTTDVGVVRERLERSRLFLFG